jgi:large subunit ribosomal protein L24
MAKMSIRKGDKVKSSPARTRARKPRSSPRFPHKERVIVERINMIKKATRVRRSATPRAASSRSRARFTSPTSCSSAPSAAQPTRIGRRREDGTAFASARSAENEID